MPPKEPMAHEKRGLDDDQDRHAYAYEYRSMLKSVITEALRENQSVIGKLFKEAVKEWLAEKFADRTAWAIRWVAALLVVGMVWLLFKPK